MTLERDDIRRGMLALQEELGHDKAVAFLRAVAGGALDAHLRAENPILSWARRNPEAVAIGAALLGVGAKVALQHFGRPRRRRHVILSPEPEPFLPELPPPSADSDD